MIILAIETSSDDTCVALLEAKENTSPDFKILSNMVSSQIKIHQKWGGIYPTIAKREHQRNLPVVFKKAIKQANNPKIDFLAVTQGPGLEPCLWTGINFAKELGQKLKLPIVPVNHIEAHILVNFVDENAKNIFPAICLIVSGGHTQLILMNGFGKYKILGETRDDAAGECFDKTARILGLEYPGGPAIASQAAKFPNPKVSRDTISVKLPRPMIYQKNYDFSFSGLKTAVLYNWKTQNSKTRKSKRYIQEISAEIQQAIIDVLIKKTLKAAKEYKAKSIILGGGVSANKELRKQFKDNIEKNLGVKYFAPKPEYSTDNAVMIAIAGYYHWLKNGRKKQKTIEANANLRLE